MKLNPDCIRDILICVEEDVSPSSLFRYDISDPPDKLKKYSSDEVIYHANQLYMSKLVTDYTLYDTGTFFDIYDLSPAGHEFIANIRQDKIWNGVKSVSKKIGSSSITALTSIASNVITEIIKSYFGIGQTPNS